MLRDAGIVVFFVVAISAYPNLSSNTQPDNQPGTSVNVMCQKANATDKTEGVERSQNDYFGCVKNVVDFDQLKDEIAGAKSNRSDLNILIKKYCNKATELKTCLHDYMDGVEPCLTQAQKAFLSKKLADQVIDYVCFNDGERLASFIAAKGIECIQGQGANNIQQCYGQLASSVSDENKMALSQNILNPMIYCGFNDQLAKCFVTSYKSCDPATPGIILEALYSFVRNNSVCKDAPPRQYNNKVPKTIFVIAWYHGTDFMMETEDDHMN